MNAPDKIFKHLTTGNRLLNGQYYEYKPAKIRNDDEIIEYIRKDALMEWIQEARAIPHENAIVRDLAFQEVINKLNAM